jgi:hypothetical protein
VKLKSCAHVAELTRLPKTVVKGAWAVLRGLEQAKLEQDKKDEVSEQKKQLKLVF